MPSSQTEPARQLADLLDQKFRGPFGIRFGLDGILGLIPGLGDFITTALAFSLLLRAAFLGASPVLLLRMGLNILIDNALGAIPILGNVLDFFFRANTRNMRLLDRHLADPLRTQRASKVYVGIVLFGILLLATAILVGGAFALVAFLAWLFHRPDWVV